MLFRSRRFQQIRPEAKSPLFDKNRKNSGHVGINCHDRLPSRHGTACFAYQPKKRCRNACMRVSEHAKPQCRRWVSSSADGNNVAFNKQGRRCSHHLENAGVFLGRRRSHIRHDKPGVTDDSVDVAASTQLVSSCSRRIRRDDAMEELLTPLPLSHSMKRSWKDAGIQFVVVSSR